MCAQALGERKLADRKEEPFPQGNWPEHGEGGTQGIEGDGGRGGAAEHGLNAEGAGCSIPGMTQADGGDGDFEVTLEYEQRGQDRYLEN